MDLDGQSFILRRDCAIRRNDVNKEWQVSRVSGSDSFLIHDGKAQFRPSSSERFLSDSRYRAPHLLVVIYI